MSKCFCGHEQSEHVNGTGQCKACDLNAGYGGNDSCSHFSLAKPPAPPKVRTVEDRLADLENEVKLLKRKFNF
jgi:hypothetical protein